MGLSSFSGPRNMLDIYVEFGRGLLRAINSQPDLLLTMMLICMYAHLPEA